jgi:hypothetical protein
LSLSVLGQQEELRKAKFVPVPDLRGSLVSQGRGLSLEKAADGSHGPGVTEDPQEENRHHTEAQKEYQDASAEAHDAPSLGWFEVSSG